MQQKFVKNIAYLVGLNLIIKPFWIFGIDRTVQNKLGEGEYGLYYALFNLGLLLNILLDLGINNYQSRKVAQSPEELKNRFRLISGIKVLLFLAYGLIVFGAAAFLGYRGKALQWLVFLVINHGLLSFLLYLRSNLGGLLRFQADRILSVLDKGLMIAFAGVLLLPPFQHHLTIGNFIYTQTAAYLVTLLVGLSFLRKETPLFPFQFNFDKTKKILRESLPFAFLILLMAFYSRMDAVMIERLLPNGKVEAGIYAKGFRLLDAGNMVAYLFSVLLLPLFSKMLKDQENIGPLVGIAVKTLIYPLLVLSAAFWVFKQPLFDLLYWESNPYQANVFGLLILNLIPMGSVYIFGTLLTAANKLRFLNTMALLGVVLNFGLNWWLIPIYKAEGAAYATLITQYGLAIVQLVAALFYFRLTKTGLSGWRASGVVAVLVLMIVITQHFLAITWSFFVGFCIIGLAFLFLTGAIRLKEVKGIFGKINP